MVRDLASHISFFFLIPTKNNTSILATCREINASPMEHLEEGEKQNLFFDMNPLQSFFYISLMYTFDVSGISTSPLFVHTFPFKRGHVFAKKERRYVSFYFRGNMNR